MTNEFICKCYTCDVCGAKEYKKYLGKTEMDGGFTVIDNFEKKYISYLDHQ